MFESYAKRRAERDALYLYQVREYGGELWLTYSDCLVCPCAMLNVPPVEAVERMRELYINRKKNNGKL